MKVKVGVGVLILKEGKVLLGKRSSNQEQDKLKGAGTWTMPGGGLEFSEKIKECAIRETKEETGLDLLNVDVFCVNEDFSNNNHFITIGFLCDEFKGEVKVREPEKITEWKWFDLDDLPKPMYFPSQKVINNYKQKKFFID